MKEYPSILPATPTNVPCVAQKKYDGSNLRFLWQKKRGWTRFGTRNHLFDKSDPEFGSAIEIFKNKYAEGIEKTLLENKDFRGCTEAVAYCEFFGPHSFSGWHNVESLKNIGIDIQHNNPKDLVFFDLNVHKKGFVSVRNFIEIFSNLHIPEIVYDGPLTQEFIDGVRAGEYVDGEGVICKSGSKHKIEMYKIKTLAYLELLKQRFGVGGYSKYWE